MQELPPSDFARVRPLFDPIRGLRAAVFTVLEGHQRGRVWVDQVDSPTTAVMISDFCYLTSRAGLPYLPPDSAKWLQEEVLNRQENTGIFSFSEPWNQALQILLPPYGVQGYVRTLFEFDAQRFRDLHTGWRARIPSGFALQRINAHTARETGGIPDMWGSVENFLAHGFGFCMLDESQPDGHLAIAASIQTVFMGDCHAETGVETRAQYRRKGIATALCCAYIEHCLQNGIYPEWGCINNAPSERLALKLGYTHPYEWPLLFVHTPEHLRVV